MSSAPAVTSDGRLLCVHSATRRPRKTAAKTAMRWVLRKPCPRDGCFTAAGATRDFKRSVLLMGPPERGEAGADLRAVTDRTALTGACPENQGAFSQLCIGNELKLVVPEVDPRRE